MALEIEGKVLLILPEQSGTSAAGKAWVKQELVIETEDQFPKKVCVAGMGDKIVPVIKSLTVGQKVTVHINVESKEFNGRWFSNINVWRIDKNAEGITNQPTAEEPKKSIEEQDEELLF